MLYIFGIWAELRGSGMHRHKCDTCLYFYVHVETIYKSYIQFTFIHNFTHVRYRYSQCTYSYLVYLHDIYIYPSPIYIYICVYNIYIFIHYIMEMQWSVSNALLVPYMYLGKWFHYLTWPSPVHICWVCSGQWSVHVVCLYRCGQKNMIESYFLGKHPDQSIGMG